MTDYYERSRTSIPAGVDGRFMAPRPKRGEKKADGHDTSRSDSRN